MLDLLLMQTSACNILAANGSGCLDTIGRRQAIGLLPEETQSELNGAGASLRRPFQRSKRQCQLLYRLSWGLRKTMVAAPSIAERIAAPSIAERVAAPVFYPFRWEGSRKRP